jgi:mono/diheme cytochrome c family protein
MIMKAGLVRRIVLIAVSVAIGLTGHKLAGSEGPASEAAAASLGIRFIDGSTSKLIVERNGKTYLVDLTAQSVNQVVSTTPVPKAGSGDPSDGASIFRQYCATCHGQDGKGLRSAGTPDFAGDKALANLTHEQIVDTIKNGKQGTRMPAFGGSLSPSDIDAVAAYVRSLDPRQNTATPQSTDQANPKVYQPGDDLLVSLPTGRRLDSHGMYVNFTHRFAFDPAFSGAARGGDLAGLDGFGLASFGFEYGVTSRLSVDVYRSPTIIGRPIQIAAAYNLLDEHDGQPLNVAVRLSMQGLNDFSREYTENIEGIFSRSLTHRAQIYVVPTLSVNNRILVRPTSFLSSDIPAVPGVNSFALGFGGALDVRPTVALVAEVIPTLIGGDALGIHRPAYSFGIQKKLFRHAFTLGFTNSPGTTVAQRSGTRAAYLDQSSADTPSGLVLAFDLTRQVR